MWYERDTTNTPTECVICIEAENEMYTKYAHPKAHLEAHTKATKSAELLEIKENNIEDYIDYYTFYYGREYKKIYKELYKKYKGKKDSMPQYASIIWNQYNILPIQDYRPAQPLKLVRKIVFNSQI